MKRLNFTVDETTADLLDEIAQKLYGGNKSLAVRAAVESLAAHAGHAGWVVSGYTPVQIDGTVQCHTCHTEYGPGDTLYRPVFERGKAPDALPELPTEPWLDCAPCANRERA